MSEESFEFRREDLQEMGYSGLREVEQRIIGHSRWSVLYRIVFVVEDDFEGGAPVGAFYVWLDSRPATEMQEDFGWGEGPDDPIECHRVYAVEKTVTVYE